jgi:hypothetical protein
MMPNGIQQRNAARDYIFAMVLSEQIAKTDWQPTRPMVPEAISTDALGP